MLFIQLALFAALINAFSVPIALRNRVAKRDAADNTHPPYIVTRIVKHHRHTSTSLPISPLVTSVETTIAPSATELPTTSPASSATEIVSSTTSATEPSSETTPVPTSPVPETSEATTESTTTSTTTTATETTTTSTSTTETEASTETTTLPTSETPGTTEISSETTTTSETPATTEVTSETSSIPTSETSATSEATSETTTTSTTTSATETTTTSTSTTATTTPTTSTSTTTAETTTTSTTTSLTETTTTSTSTTGTTSTSTSTGTTSTSTSTSTETQTTSTTTSLTETTTTSTSTTETSSAVVPTSTTTTCTDEATVFVTQWIEDSPSPVPTVEPPSIGKDIGVTTVTIPATTEDVTIENHANVVTRRNQLLNEPCNPSTRLNCQSPLWCFRPPTATLPAPPGAYGTCKSPLVVPGPNDRFYIKSVDYNTCYNFVSKLFESCPTVVSPPDASFVTTTDLINPEYEVNTGRLVYKGSCFTVGTDASVSLVKCDASGAPLAGQTFTAVLIPVGATRKNKMVREKIGLAKVF